MNELHETQLKALSEDGAKMKEEVIDKKETITRLELEAEKHQSEFQAGLDKLKGELFQSEQNVAALKENIAELEQAAVVSKEEREQLSQKLDESQQTVATLRSEVESRIQECSALQEAGKQHLSLIESHKNDSENLRNTVAGKDTEIVQLGN